MRIGNFTPTWAGWMYRSVAIAAACVTLVRIGLTIPQFTNEWDEGFNIAASVAIYDVHKHVMNTEHPPLVPLVAGLPLHLSGVHLPPQFRSNTIVPGWVTNSAFCSIAFTDPQRYQQVLNRARFAMLVFPTIALLFLYLLGAWIGNESVAMWSVLFFSTDATLLGHGMWVGTDAAACAGLLVSIYFGLRWIVYRRPRGALLAGVAIGFAFGCKFSLIFVLPALGLIIAIRPLSVFWSNVPDKLRTYWRRWPSIGQMAIVAVTAAFTLWAIYLFNIGRLANQSVFEHERWAKVPEWLKQMPIPMPSFFMGVAMQGIHSKAGHGAYLNGRPSFSGWWYYYPEAIALKSPVAMLIGLVIAIAAAVVSARRGIWRIVLLTIPPAVYIAAAMHSHIDIGVRLVLPALPFIYLIICLQLSGRRRWPSAALALLVALSFAETIAVHPNYIAFFNVLAGGPENGEKYLVDSNVDWGQDIGKLAKWLKCGPQRERAYTLNLFGNPAPQLVGYFGLDKAAIVQAPTPDNGGLLAISVTLLESNPKNAWIRRYPMIKRIGTSIDVFDLGVPKVASVAHPG